MNVIKEILKKVMIVIQKISPKTATKILFKKYMGYPLNLNSPQTLTEKMQWLKLNTYKDNPLITRCVDKYEVRDYVAEKGCEDNLVKLLGVWDRPQDIRWDALPDKFVLKCNHGSGSVIICNDKKTFDKNDAISRLSTWQKEDFGLHRAELSYKGVPKKIICEQLIETEDGRAPKDYKFFCSYGQPKFLFVASGRNGDEAFFDFYDLDWNHLDVRNGHPNAHESIHRPEHFEKMLSVASALSEDFPIVRVDLYEEMGRVLFGELTFLHFGGLHPFEPSEYDTYFGRMFDIQELINRKSN
ncbi:MAG: glycosyl transferase [Clostridia bacterium]|nr:glycosyl transferase [Clostridia bacterium]